VKKISNILKPKRSENGHNILMLCMATVNWTDWKQACLLFVTCYSPTGGQWSYLGQHTPVT